MSAAPRFRCDTDCWVASLQLRHKAGVVIAEQRHPLLRVLRSYALKNGLLRLYAVISPRW